MPNRRILSLWFPRLAAERLIRAEPALAEVPLAVVRESGNVVSLASLSRTASAAGLRPGQPLRDAQAVCPDLVTRLERPAIEAGFLTVLRRWAGKFSPWISEAPPEGLVVDITGCAHLFGGEAGLMGEAEADCAQLGLTVCAGVADTVGAAWALARFAGQGPGALRSGDAIDQEAYATRARAVKRRHWERGGPPPLAADAPSPEARIAAPGMAREALAPLPLAALRLPPKTTQQLARLGLRRVEELAAQPRAALARRFGADLVLRLDQAFGTAPEPVSPARPEPRYAVRLTLPEPIGLEPDLAAGIDRLLPALEARLRARGMGARRLRLHLLRCDHSAQVLELGLARPSADPERLRPLLRMKLAEVDAGDGIDVIRLVATVTEPVHAVQHRGHAGASADAAARLQNDTALDDLIGRLGARVGLEQIHRLHPGDSHVPEKATQLRAAAWSAPATDWPPRPTEPRPLTLFAPEFVTPSGPPGDRPAALPLAFRWRRRQFATASATGPERIAPEWWLDEPAWRSGQRDYWQVETACGARLWLFYAHGGAVSGGWFCHGRFA
ncbi:DNA polymerase Y family protein [Vannielia litorea]|uniref:Y-family DNA polymerase n=1 Tax=Vannielia litorea TaxID=1217970 RepID=UPI001C970983|nr:DNA polymerase Y family protein [Vannielia litorea]MBY6155333.1 DNA polymerase Y family protein [Vannielia litorea]